MLVWTFYRSVDPTEAGADGPRLNPDEELGGGPVALCRLELLRISSSHCNQSRVKPSADHPRQLRSQVYTGSVGAKNFPDFVSNPAKNGENLFFASRGFGRIIKAPVVPFHQPRKYRTRLVSVSTDRDYGVYLRIEEFLQVLRMVTRNIDPNLFHGADR
jgi:hypothetical protein